MLIRESIVKTKCFLHKALVNFRSVLYGKCHKLLKPPTLRPFFCRISKEKKTNVDPFYNDFRDEWQHDIEEAKKTKSGLIIPAKESVVEGSESRGRYEIFGRKSLVENKPEERKTEGYVLAQKIKQLDMMDAGDVEHVLDVEEALHYYSRLRSPVYVDIVDKFFTDMYSEFALPQPSASIGSSKRSISSSMRKLGSGSSMRRLGSVRV